MKSKLEKRNRKFGRRGYDRFSIPGAKVTWKDKDQGSFPDETSPLSDLSQFGVSLLTNNSPKVDSDISLRISIPRGPKQLDLYGKVVYSIYRGPGLTYEYRVGVHLKPFSTTEGDNPLKSEKTLEELEKKYGKKMDNQDIED
jgi:hypothetical protein